jgi:hypothetical protein
MINDKKIKYLEWSINNLINALDLNEEDVKKYFTDGRRVSFLTERKIAKEDENKWGRNPLLET